MRIDRQAFAAGARASLPVLPGLAPFGLICGVAMAAGWRFRKTFVTIAAGLVALYSCGWIL